MIGSLARVLISAVLAALLGAAPVWADADLTTIEQLKAGLGSPQKVEVWSREFGPGQTIVVYCA